MALPMSWITVKNWTVIRLLVTGQVANGMGPSGVMADHPRVLLLLHPRPFPFVPPVDARRAAGDRLAQLRPEEKLTRRRDYNRIKQRQFRDRVEQTLQGLRKTIQELESQLTRCQISTTTRPSQCEHDKDTVLPWEDVAVALAQSSHDSVALNAQLKADVARTKRLAAQMHAWVFGLPEPSQDVVPSIDYKLLPQTRISLTADAASRIHALAWLTDRVYFNVDRLLFVHDLHLQPTSFQDLHVQFPDDIMMIYTRRQVLHRASFDHVCMAYQHLAGQATGDFILAGRTPIDTEAAAALAAKEVVYSQLVWIRNDRPWVDNKIWRTYRSPNRVVIVSQNVHNDPAYPVTSLQRFRVGIVVVDRLNDHETLTRELNFNSHAFHTADGAFVSLDQEGRQYDMDFSDLAPDDIDGRMRRLQSGIEGGGRKHLIRQTNRFQLALDSTRGFSE